MARKTKHNSIVTEELLKQVNSENMALLNDFIEYLRSAQKSEGTVYQYASDIKIAWVWGLKYCDNKSFIDWKKRDIVRFQNWLISNNGNSPARVRRIKASLSSLSNAIETLWDDDYPDFRNIIRKIESPVLQPVREKTVLMDTDVEELLDELTNRGQYERACVVALALYSGRRKSELPRFRVSDFTDDRLVCNGALYKTSAIKTKGRGVNGKQLECFCLAKKFKPYLDRWMQYREENNIESEWLFPDRNDPTKPISVSTIDGWTDSFGKITGVDFYWHSLRHTRTSEFKRAGIPDTVIQAFIGWSDISMVGVYSDLDTSSQLSMYFNGDSADGISMPEQKSLSDL